MVRPTLIGCTYIKNKKISTIFFLKQGAMALTKLKCETVTIGSASDFSTKEFYSCT